jgi:transglutaminase-like putative cysteine protease
MEIRAGYEIAFTVRQRTSMILMLNVHPSRRRDLVTEDNLVVAPSTPLRPYRDTFGNICTRVVVPAGPVEFSTSFVIRDSGLPDETVLKAREHPVDELPEDVLVYLLGSRYCDTQRLSDFAWRRFGAAKPGWTRVQAICDSCMTTSNLDTPTRVTTGRRPTHFTRRWASVATLPIWPSRCVVA